MKRNKLLLAISLLSRVITGLISLFVLARGLGPIDYGFVATVFAYSSIGALLTDFGFSTQALRDIGAEPLRAGELIAACIRVKNVLVVLLSVAALLILLSIRLETHLRVAGSILYLSIVVMSYGDLVVVALRGMSRYWSEALAALAGSVVFVLVVGGAVLISADIVFLSSALLIARVTQTVIAFRAVRRYTLIGNCLVGPIGDLIRFTRTSSGFALDSALTTMTGQLDVIVVSAVLGLESAGTYQVAARVASYAILPAQVLAGVNIPALSSELSTMGSVSAGKLGKFFGEYLALGTVAASCYAVFMKLFSDAAFGTEYRVGAQLWVAFSVLVLARYLTASTGVALIVYGAVRWRVMVQVLSVLNITILAGILARVYGVVGAAWGLAIAILLAAGMYAFGLARLSSHR